MRAVNIEQTLISAKLKLKILAEQMLCVKIEVITSKYACQRYSYHHCHKRSNVLLQFVSWTTLIRGT